MPNFCSQCGSPVSGPFCGSCGAKADPPKVQSAQPAAAAPPAAPVPTPPTPPAPPAQVAVVPAPKSSSASKILIAIAVVVVVFGAMAAGGIYYAVRRVKQRVHQLAAEYGTDGTMNSAGGGNGDVCRYLSKEDVSKALGIEIVATRSESDSGCSYLAHGTAADMTAKHLSAMAGARGADAKSQQMVEQFASGIFKSSEEQKGDLNEDAAGNVPVLSFSIDTNAAETQMKLNGNILGSLPGTRQDLPGIGDEAYDLAGAMVFVRKGDKLVRIMYATCPCTLDAIKPLAKELADSL
jgi:hypothetical protein